MQRATIQAVKGGVTVTTGGQVSQTIVEGSFPGCTVSVFNTGTSNLTTIYGDNLNPPTPKANPFTADANGFGFFYAANGSRVDVQLSGTGVTTPFVVAGDILLDDPSLLAILAPQTVAFSATPTFDLSQASWFKLTLTGNVTGPVFSNPVTGSILLLSLTQNAVGGFTFAFPGSFTDPPAIALAANARTELIFKYDGTNWTQVAATGDNTAIPTQLLASNGTAALPSIALASSQTTGFWRQAADVIGVSIAGALRWLMNATGFLFGSGQSIRWSSNADPSAAIADTGISRLAAKTLAIGNGTQGDSTGTLKVENEVVANFNTVIWLDNIKYTSLAAAYAAIPTATFAASGDGIGTVWTGGGGVVEVPPGWIDPAWAANLVLKNNASIHFNGPAYINQGTFQVTAAANIHGVSITNPYGDHSQRTSGVTFDYSGNGDAWALGDGTNNGPVSDIRVENIQIHTINGGLASNALHVHGSQYCNFINLDLVVANGATNTGNGLLLDGTGAGVFNTQNLFVGLTINFSNNPVSFTGNNTDNIYIGGLVGNPHGTGGPAFSIAGSSTRNQFINTAILSGTFASFYNFSGTASGNRVSASNGGGFTTLTAVFGATSNYNIYDVIGGSSASYTDAGAGNRVNDPTLSAKIHLTAQQANVGPTTLLTVPASTNVTYRVHVYAAETRVGTTSTMVSVTIGWTDPDSNTAVTFVSAPGTPAGNVINNPAATDVFLTFIINAKAGTAITYQTTNYASTGGTPMQYALTITVDPQPD